MRGRVVLPLEVVELRHEFEIHESRTDSRHDNTQRYALRVMDHKVDGPRDVDLVPICERAIRKRGDAEAKLLNTEVGECKFMLLVT